MTINNLNILSSKKTAAMHIMTVVFLFYYLIDVSLDYTRLSLPPF